MSNHLVNFTRSLHTLFQSQKNIFSFFIVVVLSYENEVARVIIFPNFPQ